MERLKELISQLKEQSDRGVNPALMLRTAQLLEEEIRLLASKPAPAKVMPTKITVMMPSAVKIVAPPMPDEELAAPAEARPAPVNGYSPAASATNGTGINGTPAINGTSGINGTPATNGTPVISPYANGNTAAPPYSPGTPVSTPHAAAAVIDTETPAAAMPDHSAVASDIGRSLERPLTTARATTPERGTWPFDPLAEKPTDRFTLSQKTREINDVIGTNGTSSLNEKLKSDIVELKSALNDTPVRDLRKAIGINDRYVFINQLFRGDEVMYERSLKTINGFRILPEAEYWMERELKVKLGWDENREATRHFYQLVKRRFS
jgi:hypothetical protein